MNYTGELSALLTALLWSGTSYAFATASKRIGPLQTNINRMIIASILLAVSIIIFQFNYELSLTQIQYLVFSGIVGLVLGDSFLFKAFQLIGARLSILMMALAPAMSAILAYIFLKEELSALGIIGMIVTLSGIALVVLEKKPSSEKINHNISALARQGRDRFGLLCGFLGALGQASGLIFAKFAFQESDVNKMVATFVRLFSSVIIILPAAIIFRRYKNPIHIYNNDRKSFYATLIGTFLGPYLGITFSLIAIDHTKIGIAATLMATMPIIMLPMSTYIFKEHLSWRAISGAVLAVIGVAILFMR